jgi:hypothetical protein
MFNEGHKIVQSTNRIKKLRLKNTQLLLYIIIILTNILKQFLLRGHGPRFFKLSESAFEII